MSEPVYELGMSKRGDNTLYITCDAVGYSQNFAVCQHVLAKHKEGKLPQSYNGCAAAIDSNNCQAAKMQKEEEDAGTSLYYRPRIVLQQQIEKQAEEKPADKNSASYLRGRYGPDYQKKVDQIAVKQEKALKKETGIIEMNHAAIVNAVSDTVEQPKTRQKGESPVDFLKRIRGG